MNAIDLVADASRIGLAVIFNCLWQGALIAGVAWLTLRIFSRANATTRYAVWSLTLLAMLIVPVVTSLSRVSFTPQIQATTQPAVTHVPTQSARTVTQVAVPKHTETSATAPTPWYASRVFTVNIPLLASAVLFGAWILGALFILARLVFGLMQLERLKSDSLPLDIAYRDTMPRWSAALKGERDVRICVSEHVEVPVAVGLFDSMILLPAHLVQTLEAAEIDQISLHELGHLLRGDDWTNAMQRLVGALMFFSPAAWFVSRQMDVEREVACDDYVLESTGAVRPYAFCLTKMAEMTVWPHNPVPAPGVFVTRKNISIRIERLLRTGRAIGSSIAPNIAGVVTIALIAVFLLLRTMTPGIAFTVPVEAVSAVSAVPAHPAKVAKAKSEPVKTQTVALVATAAPVAAVVPPMTPAASAHQAVKSAEAAASNAALAAKNAETAAKAPLMVAQVPARPSTSSMVASNGSCTGCDFADANLAGRDFSDRSLEGTNFNRANLRNARFDRAQLTGSNFNDADLRGASFVDAHLEGCNMRGARVDGARFDGADLTGCSIDISAFSPEQARVFLTRCRGCDLSHANLRGQDLHDIHIDGADLRGADLRNANLSGASFTGIDFSGAQLAGANVNGASFIGCDFRGVDLRGVDLSKANLTGSSMSGATW